jgi:AraC-like DNA-binding protein
MKRPATKMRISLQEFIEHSDHSNPPVSVEELSSGNMPTKTHSPPWHGNIVVESLRQGFQIFIVNVWAPVDLEIGTEFTDRAVGFALALEGNSVQTVPGTDERVSALPITAGHDLAAVCRPEETHLHLPGGQWHRIVKLQIEPEQMSAMLDGQERNIPDMLRPVILPSKPWRASVRKPLSPTLECIGNQLVNCPFTGAARKLFLEGKALEILAEELGEGNGNTSPKRGNYAREDLDSLELARTILDQEYTDPPTILDLSRRVGLNDFKLKRGFKDLYGTTIFGHVRKLRMEKARALLEAGTYNVTEVALETGHSCLGHFSAAFKKAFGVVPSRYRAGSRATGHTM